MSWPFIVVLILFQPEILFILFLSLSLYFFFLISNNAHFNMCFIIETCINVLLVVCVLSIEELWIIKGRKLQFLRGSIFFKGLFVQYCFLAVV